MPRKKDRNGDSPDTLADFQKKMVKYAQSDRKNRFSIQRAKAEMSETETRQRLKQQLKKAAVDFLLVTEGGRERRYLRLKDVLKRFPVSQSTWYAGMKTGRFPKGTRLGLRTVAWLESDIDELIAKSRQAGRDQV